MSLSTSKMKIAIAGASGFVGRALIDTLLEKSGEIEVIGLSRARSGIRGRVEWRQCDLFNLMQAENCLDGADVAVYLVHSMLPSAKLTQGSFADLDLLIADNFGRAAKKAGVKRIIYLGGIIPDEDLSPHLASRLEVEKALASHGVPCITLRAGLIIGRNGSSFDIMRKLVERLPLMVCPGWTRTRSQPVSLNNVIQTIVRLIDRPDIAPGSYDLGGRDVVTYIDMMQRVANIIGKRRIFIPIFLFSPNLSRLWVTLVTGAPRELIGPLVQSLRHEMVARNTDLMRTLNIDPDGFSESLAQAMGGAGGLSLKSRKSRKSSQTPASVASLSSEEQIVPVSASQPVADTAPANKVCSVQRMPLQPGRDVVWMRNEYARWLWNFFSPWIVIRQTEDGSLEFIFQLFFRRLQWRLLWLRYAPERSSLERQLFYISGGLLLNRNFDSKGRFEFREVLSGQYVMIAIFDFIPALPWWVYKNTQAVVHLMVMNLFRRHLLSVYRKNPDGSPVPAQSEPLGERNH